MSDGLHKDGQRTPVITDEQLLAYMEGRLDPEARRMVEHALTESAMEADAIEGLMDMPDALPTVNRLNARLRKQLHAAPKRRRAKTELYVLAAVAVVLLLAIAAYMVLHLYANR